ncbi:hypothetical protein ASE63_18455 [Bosea sp. Root381]|uniref:hypothetical protein n=1 Tax=Bosea sp. Root381 TaxID=1736524 RepID=UPI0006FB9F2B|nr:hypothetical protein [Bosea sp. Root381]KRE13455.1 hypothetical protein ASE63_18455 [Bosea sp. Root381]
MMKESTYLVRIGRVCWWGALAFTGGMATLGVVVAAQAMMGRYGYVDDLVGGSILCAVVLLSGRGLRYVLANE